MPTKKKAAKKTAKTSTTDIVKLILEDHKPLKKLIKVLKDTDKHDLKERKAAFKEFAPLLTVHAKAEEQVLYVFMKDEDELREEGFEGDVEHTLADQMVEETRRATDEDVWSAKAKVLAELVEHHIEEEEEELLPDFKKHAETEERADMGAQYLELKQKVAIEEQERNVANKKKSEQKTESQYTM